MPIAFLTSIIAIPISLTLEGGDEGGDVNSNGDCIDECGPINPAVLGKSFLVRWKFQLGMNYIMPKKKKCIFLKKCILSEKFLKS